MIELTSLPGCFIVAIPYRNRRPKAARPIPDGAIVETVPADLHRQHVPRLVAPYYEDPASGRFFGLVGTYLLSTGEPASLYGAEAGPIDR